MSATARFIFQVNLKCSFSTSTMVTSKYISRHGKFMKKLMNRDGGKRKWYVNKPVSSNSPLSNEKIFSSHVTRRITVLNKIFMEHITDLMATGEVSSDLLGRGLEISRVQLTPDFRLVLVYWSSKKITKENSVEFENALDKCAFKLRHELTQLRVIGQVPMIKFVKDKQLTSLVELEQRMNIADYGEDYEPTIDTYIERKHLTLTASLPDDVRNKILELDKFHISNDGDEVEVPVELDEDESKYEVDLPPMRHDVLGLNHWNINARVKQSMSKTHEAAKNRLKIISTDESTLIKPDTINYANLASFATIKEDSKAFAQFLLKRQIDERRKMRYENRKLDDFDSDDDFHYDNINDLEEFAADVDDVDELEDIVLNPVK